MRWEFPWKFSVKPELGEVEGWMVGKSEWTPAQIFAPGFCWKFWNEPYLGDVRGVLVVKCESDVLGSSDRGLVGRSLKAWRSVHPMSPGWGDV